MSFSAAAKQQCTLVALDQNAVTELEQAYENSLVEVILPEQGWVEGAIAKAIYNNEEYYVTLN